MSAVLVCATAVAAQEQTALRVCADPNNLPMSNQEGQGFENKIAELVAKSLNARLEYTWWTQRKSFAQKSLDADACDVVMGVPAAMPDVLVTKPYYRSTYVFVWRQDRNLQIASLTDPRLANLRIGVHVVGDDYAPPAFALARQGITKNVVGFSLVGKYEEANPPRRLIDAVERRDIDLAIVWGPLAGYFAKGAKAPLDVAPVSPAAFLGVPFAYDIAAAVRKDNQTLKTELDRVLASQSIAIQGILQEYAVPQVQ